MSTQKHDSDTDSPVENERFLEAPFKRLNVKEAISPALLDEDDKELNVLFTNPKRFEEIIKGPTTSTHIRRPSNMDDDDDDDLGFDPKQPKLGNKSNLFDDILKDNVSISRPATTGKSAVSRQSTATTSDTSNMFNLTRPKTTAGRRSSTVAPPNTDTLDPGSKPVTTHFDSKASDSIATASKMSQYMQRGTTANWLGLDLETLESAEDIQDQNVGNKSSSAPKTGRTYDIKVDEEINNAENSSFGPIDSVNQSTPVSTTKNIMDIKSLDRESNKSYIIAHRQEDTSAMAVNVQKQKQTLNYMAEKQNSLLQMQQHQYQSFIEQQIVMQEKMQEFIEKQKNRIATHLKLMKEQTFQENPVLVFSSTSKESEPRAVNQNTEDLTAMCNALQKEVDVKRLEMENERLEALIVNINANYKREIEALVTSYK